MNPAGSPFGDTSRCPEWPAEARTTNGDLAMNRMQSVSSVGLTLPMIQRLGRPTIARSSASVVITSAKRPFASIAVISAPRIFPRGIRPAGCVSAVERLIFAHLGAKLRRHFDLIGQSKVAEHHLADFTSVGSAFL